MMVIMMIAALYRTNPMAIYQPRGLVQSGHFKGADLPLWI